MAGMLEAVRRCESKGLDPEILFSNQFVLTQDTEADVPGMTAQHLDDWVLHHGQRLECIPMRDASDRLFGLFLGIGVDGAGQLVAPDSFSRLNSEQSQFKAQLEDFLTYTSGRYLALTLVSGKAQLWFDPMAQLATFYNAKERLAGSSVFLASEHAPDNENELIGPPAAVPEEAIRVFPMGRTSHSGVRLMPANHVLDLSDFSLRRCWPLGSALGTAVKRRVRTRIVIAEMAARQRAVVNALLSGCNSVLPVSGDVTSHITLSAIRGHESKISQFCCVQGDDEHACDAAALAMENTPDVTLDYLKRTDVARLHGDKKPDRRNRKRLFWLRTSTAYRAPNAVVFGLDQLMKERHLLLQTDGFDVLQTGWHRSWWSRLLGRSPGRDAALDAALGHVPVAEELEEYGTEVQRWQDSLPKSLRRVTPELLQLERHMPARAVSYYGFADQFSVNLLSDRRLIELALMLPLTFRSSPGFAHALLEELHQASAPVGSTMQDDAQAEQGAVFSTVR